MIDKLMIVSHPDDEALFGGAELLTHPDEYKVVEYATYDERLGKSHWAVPGPDGDYGFGGHCLPKDVSAIVSEFDSELLKSVLNVNNKVRKNRDWEKMKGRAVIE